jgi:hypothetical protein
MAMELLAFHNQFVADLAPDNQDNNLVSFHIVQGTQVSCPQLELGQRVGAQPFTRPGGRRGMLFEPGQDGRFQDSLVADRQ